MKNGVCFLNIRIGIKRIFILLSICLAGCDKYPWNDPYPNESPVANTLYSFFTERPKHLDPARSYTESEWTIIAQIYEPPLQYHYLKRPYVLEPLTAAALPEVRYFGKNGEILSDKSDPTLVAYTDYIIRIKPGTYYQMHPAFAKDMEGKFRYHHLSIQDAEHYYRLSDFKELGTRELIAEDFVYQIKRLAEPHLGSPIFGLMSRYIEGLTELRATLLKAIDNHPEKLELDLRAYPLSGVAVIDRYSYKVRIKGKYPQFKYWLSMPFFAPVPWEVAQFYAQPGLEEHNISLDWYPVGTGPFMLTENNPDRRMTLIKNPKFRLEYYPSEGSAEDIANGLLADAGKRLPMIDKVIFTLEKENIPQWNKFLQGYYDTSGISSDNFGSAIHFSPNGGVGVTDRLREQGIRLQTAVAPSVWYWGFNMLDETVGGYTDKARHLRKAISMAFDVEEFLSIFMNSRGTLATGPLPPDIFGYETEPKFERSNLEKARQLLKSAGIAEGTTFYIDAVVSGNPDEIAEQAWVQEQFAKIGLNVVIRGTDYNRFQEKVRLGTVQMFFQGWHGDYPDPENFLFLLYGPNASVYHEGVNGVNYNNPEYNRLFEKMRTMSDTPERLQVIQKMIDILQLDTPWIWGFYPKSYALRHNWVRVGKPSAVANNTLKYIRIDPVLRASARVLWNQPILWPLWLFLIMILIVVLPAVIWLWRKEHHPLKRL